MARYYEFLANNEIEKILRSVISKSGPFNDEQGFIEHLIKNYDAKSRFYLGKDKIAEVVEPLIIVNAEARKNLENFVKNMREEFEQSGPYNKIKNLRQIDIYGPHHAGLIYHWQTRILPIKFILTVLAKLIVTKKTEPIRLEDLKEAVIVEVDGFVEKIEHMYNGMNDPKKLKNVLVGFPMSVTLPPWENKKPAPKLTQVLRSRRRFIEHFLGRKTTSKNLFNMGIKASALDKMQIADDLGISNADGMAGACFEMGLLDAWEEGGDVLIIPSNIGLKFMCMTNPVLEHIYNNKELQNSGIYELDIFSEGERTLFRNNILSRFELEKEIIDKFFKKADDEGLGTELLQDEFNKNQIDYFEKFWIEKAWSKFRVKIISLFTESKDDMGNDVKIFKMIIDNESSDSKMTEEKRGIQKDTKEMLWERIENYWKYHVQAYQRVHLVVMLSRLTELGYCEKSKKRPFTYSFYN